MKSLVALVLSAYVTVNVVTPRSVTNGSSPQLRIRNMGAYMRRMALCGSNNLNQVAIHANTYGGIYPEEISALQRDYSALWGPLSDLLKQLSALVEL